MLIRLEAPCRILDTGLRGGLDSASTSTGTYHYRAMRHTASRCEQFAVGYTQLGKTAYIELRGLVTEHSDNILIDEGLMQTQGFIWDHGHVMITIFGNTHLLFNHKTCNWC